MKIGLVQDSLGNVEAYIREAKEKGCQVLCFPEAFLTGYVPSEVSMRAVSRDSWLGANVGELAKAYQMDIVAGFMEQEKEQYYLTQGIFKADGQMLFHRKTHLGEREHGIFSEGNTLDVYSLTCGLKIGIQICMENHFPEITQILSLKGAEVVFAPFAVPGTPEKRKEVWSKIMPARSYDNRVYMACCNLWNGERFCGGCMVTDPNGEIVAENYENKPGLLIFTYEEEAVRRYHEGNPSMKYRYYPEKRRVELFGS